MPLFVYTPISVLIGLELLVAGVAKLVWAEGFPSEVTQAVAFPTWLVAPLVSSVPLAEVGIGIALLSLAPLRLIVGAAASLYGIFTLHHAILSVQRASTPCGCLVNNASTHKAAVAITGSKCLILVAMVIYPASREVGLLANVVVACVATSGAVGLWARGRVVARTAQARLVAASSMVSPTQGTGNTPA